MFCLGQRVHMCVAEPTHVLELAIVVHLPRISRRHLIDLCCKLSFFFVDLMSTECPDTNQIWISGRYDGWNIPNIYILFPACTAIVPIPMGCPLSNCCLGSSSKVVLPWVPSIPDDKQNHPSRCLQQGSPHHPFESGYAIPLNSAKRSIVIALGWYKEFQWSRYQK